MPGLVTVLPLAIVMLAGPQIISPFFLAMSENWKRNSAAFLSGALLAVTFFVTLAYIVARALHRSVGESHKSTAGQVIGVGILILLALGAFNVFRTRWSVSSCSCSSSASRSIASSVRKRPVARRALGPAQAQKQKQKGLPECGTNRST